MSVGQRSSSIGPSADVSNSTRLAKQPVVSVVMITYNHEKFIEQAVKSVLMQETDFDYEIVIGEDCSTDRTREILVQLQRSDPDKINLVLNAENQGMIPNFVHVLTVARGKYVSLLEGDDYWTSPHKLQRQVDYMEAHSEARMCFHRAQEVYEDGRKRMSTMVGPPRGHHVSIVNWLRDRARGRKAHIATSTVLFRKPPEDLPAWFSELRAMGDWPLFLWLHTKGGHLQYLDHDIPMSVHRVHRGGVSYHRSQEALLDWLQDFLLIRNHMGHFWPYLKPVAASVCRRISENYLTQGNLAQGRSYFVESLRCSRWVGDKKSLVQTLGLALKCYLPRIFRILRRIKRSLAD